MMSRRSSLRNSSSSTCLVLQKSAATPNPGKAETPVVPPVQQLPLSRSQSTTYIKRTQSNIGNHHEYDHQNQKLPTQKKSQSVTDYYPFPKSPDLEDALGLGEGIKNSNHPQHGLVQMNLPTLFVCMGCKEYGAGSRFTCTQCNFELHDFCALAPPVLKVHPLHSQHQLVFHPKPGKGLLKPACDVCGKAAKGTLFKCSACSFQLHPCCAMLSAKMTFSVHPHPLVILPGTANLGGDVLCAQCKRKRSGQMYRCSVCDYYLHAVCAKSMVNGLHVNGFKGLDNGKGGSYRVLGVAAKLASHVVIGFMGGIVEGLGEGLGEALTQNFAKGRCTSNGRISLYPGN